MGKENNRDVVLLKTNKRCGYCGVVLEKKWQVDHIIPKARFHNYSIKNKLNYGVNDIENLLASCASCNNYKSVLFLEDFRFQLTQLVERCNKHSAAYRIAKRFGLVSEINKDVVFYFETLITKE